MKKLRGDYPAMPRSIAALLATLLSALGFLALFAAMFRQESIGSSEYTEFSNFMTGDTHG